MIPFLFFIIVINLILILFFKPLSNFYNQFDYPDSKRKIHSKPVSLLGGTFVIINIFFVIFFDKLFFSIIDYKIFKSFTGVYIFLFLSLVFFLLGFFDDKFNISANKKLFLTFSFLNILFLILF